MEHLALARKNPVSNVIFKTSIIKSENPTFEWDFYYPEITRS